MKHTGIRFLGILLSAVFLFGGAQGAAALTQNNASAVTAAAAPSATPSSATRGKVAVKAADRYTLRARTYSLDVTTPQFSGLAEADAQAALNAAFKAESEKLVADFKAGMEDLESSMGPDAAHMALIHGFKVLTDTKRYYAVEVYTLSIQADAGTAETFYTVDKATGKIISLKDLFKPNADYVSRISNGIYVRMKAMNAKEDGLFFLGQNDWEGSFNSIRPDQSFYIDKEGRIVICFQKFEVAAGAQGSPQFTLNMDALKNLLK